jgi:hypothetical protein
MRRRGRFRALGVFSGLLIALGTPGLAAADQTLEAESMTVPAGQGRVVSDARASGGAALQLWSNTTATTTVDTAAPYGRIWLRARGAWCDGSGPTLNVTVDGRSAGYIAASDPAAYRDLEAFLDVGPGSHTLDVRLTNYVTDPGLAMLHAPCDRSAFLDTVTLKASPSVFAASSWRNQPLPDSEPIDPNSAAFVAELGAEVQSTGSWVNTTSFSTPIYVAGVQTARRHVEVDQLSDPLHPMSASAAAALRNQWSDVPLPAGAQPARGSDRHLTVYQPAADTLWEFWKFGYDLLGNPQAAYGGRIQNVSQDPAYYRDPPAGPGRGFGATATSIPLLAGVQWIKELQASAINHAVDFVAPGWKEDVFRWPAQRTDALLGHVPPAQPLPEGIRFRLPPGLDIDALGLPPYTRMLARAVQRYGMVMADAGANVAFRAETPKPGEPDPYGRPNGIFGGLRPDQLLATFPWDRLEAIADTGQP